MPLAWDEVPTVEAEAFTLATVPSLYAERGDPGAGIDAAVGSLEALLELSARDEAKGLGDAPWPPTYRKQPGEPPRVQPSKQRRAAADYDTPEAEAEREKSRAALERRWSGTRPTPTGRRQSAIPVIEIARAAKKDDALAGLERWKARWPKAAAALEPPDVLVDAMRGRSTTWTRVRVNLTHVPTADRPPQEPLDPDYDPTTEYPEADRAAWLERPGQRLRQAGSSGASSPTGRPGRSRKPPG
jgi:hypothetical protein